MATKKRKRSAPEFGPAIKYRATPADVERLQWLASHYEMNASATMRRLILEAYTAERVGIRTPKRSERHKAKARPRKAKRARKAKSKRAPELRAAA